MRNRFKVWAMLLVILCVFVMPSPVQANIPYTHTRGDLVALLIALRTRSDWTRMYSVNRFDCSNMSALLDAILDEAGFASAIVYGDLYTFDQDTGLLVRSGGHAMLLVVCDVPDSLLITWVEATNLVPYAFSGTFPHWLSSGDYFVPRGMFATAAQACAARPWEFSWTDADIKRIRDSLALR